MARVPFIGRLYWREYVALLGSLVLILLEGIIRIITLGLPQFVIRFCYKTSKKIFNWLSSPQVKQARSTHDSNVNAIAASLDFIDLCALFGYYAEEHVVQTSDGYLLGLHRLCWRSGEENPRINAGEGSTRKSVVYLHHGLLMNSEVWVSITDVKRCLPFMLVEKGYDVWCGNSRGNKYAKKSTRFSPNSNEFWDFSMDQFAFHDIPDSIGYILTTTAQPSLSYVGFSQGSAQAFATLSIHPTLNDKVDVFIALAPAMSPAGLRNGIVNSLVKASPSVLFLAFGRRSILSSATFWQSILYPPIFVRIIDLSLSFLFSWSGKNISMQQKLAAYPHLYSFTSTKSVVHWFQIIRNKSFQMFDDELQAPLAIGASDRYYRVARFPTRNIKTPIVLLYGGSDSLVDIEVMLRQLPKHTVAREVPHFEHLDFLWGQDIETLVFPHVFAALNVWSGHDHSKTGWSSLRNSQRLAIAQSQALSEDDTSFTAGECESANSHAGWYERTQRKDLADLPISPTSSSSPEPRSTPIRKFQNKLKSMAIDSTPDDSAKRSRKRNGGVSSIRTLENTKRCFGQNGINIGIGQTTIGITTTKSAKAGI